jgi:hypothetical protein
MLITATHVMRVIVPKKGAEGTSCGVVAVLLRCEGEAELFWLLPAASGESPRSPALCERASGRPARSAAALAGTSGSLHRRPAQHHVINTCMPWQNLTAPQAADSLKNHRMKSNPAPGQGHQFAVSRSL